MKISKKEKEELLGVARSAIHAAVTGEQVPREIALSFRGNEKLGVFVTLYLKGGLRGCIGYLPDIEILNRGLIDSAVNAARNDPRFPPVSEKELPGLEIEISLLSPLQKIQDISEIKVGRDGLFIVNGFHKGLLLPKVAVEHNWDVDTFLKHTCIKAGLPQDAWKNPETGINIFSAEVISEK